MSVCWRRGSALLVPASVAFALCAASPKVARAEATSETMAAATDLDATRLSPSASPTLYGFGREALARNEVVLESLERIAEFHPETDRWTDRNDRIRITFWNAVWAYSGNLRLELDDAFGIRINWEVPGFIGVRLETGFAGLPVGDQNLRWSKMVVKPFGPGFGEARVHGWVNNTSLTLAIFNPELSTPAGPMAFWAGFGPEFWVFSYSDPHLRGGHNRIGSNFRTPYPAEQSDNPVNAGFQVFVEFDFKMSDTLHLGIGFKEHIVYAKQVQDGAYYNINGVSQARGLDRGNFGIALVHDLFVSVSVLF